MSERSELHHYGAFFAAQRRSAHWCLVMSLDFSVSAYRRLHQ
jgi:hypothetical protein